MARDELAARLRATFVLELEEHLRELTKALLELEQRPNDDDIIRRLFRSAHTIKGAAGVAGVPLIERVCHVLESVFAGVRNGGRTLDGSAFSLLFATLDALTEAGERLPADVSLSDSPVAALLPRLAALAGDDSADAAAGETDWEAPAGAAMYGDEPRGDTGASDRVDEPVPQGQARAPAKGAGIPAERRPDSADEWVRVRADQLDALLAAAGELAIVTERAERNRQDEDFRNLGRVTARVADVVRHLRLRPFADVCEALPRAVRDIAAREGKQVVLDVAGEDVTADRVVVDMLRDPLLHLVRNAADHGIEAPDVRVRLGKPPTGRIRVAAALGAGRLTVTVSDDGAGLDEAAIRQRLQRLDRPAPRSQAELAEALLRGAFSTRAAATAISGRGVGLDLSRSAIERIGGTLDLHWERDRGTTFTIQCPPSPATIRALLIDLRGHMFAFATAHVERVRHVRHTDIHRSEGRVLVASEHGPVTVHALAALLGPPLEAQALKDSAPLVIVSAGARRAGFFVDDVVAETEIVVRPLDLDDGAVAYASGAALLPSGRVALVLSVNALLAAGTRSRADAAPSFAPAREAPPIRVLVADDSITTRMLEQSVLEAAGYEVTTAVDGEDAWRKLEQTPVDVVIADVEMPRMDGFALCRRIRASTRLADLPVIMVTALSSEADRARGLDVGADAYIEKSGFDQSMLLDTIQQLVGAT